MRRICHFVLGTTLAAAATFAHASPATATWADMSQIRVQLTDLNPGDGVSPSLIARPGGSIWSAVQTDVFVPALGDRDEQYLNVSYFPALPVTADSVTLVRSPVSGTAQREPDRLFTSATGAPALITESYAWWEIRATYGTAPNGDQLFTGSFDLSPGTAVTLTANYSVLATVAAGIDGFATSSVMMRGLVGTGSYAQFTTDGAYASVSAPGQQSSSGLLTITLTNNADTPLPVYFETFAMSYASVSSVPEPGMLALTLAGLAVLGLRGRAARRH